MKIFIEARTAKGEQYLRDHIEIKKAGTLRQKLHTRAAFRVSNIKMELLRELPYTVALSFGASDRLPLNPVVDDVTRNTIKSYFKNDGVNSEDYEVFVE